MGLRALAWPALALTALLGGCASLGYYAQSVQGQLDILHRERPISEVVDASGTPPPLRAKLEDILKIRAFASEDLGLPDNQSYRRYADLRRPYVVWVVFAAPEFSLKPKRWCFPFAGCVTYRGYFHKDEAQRFADDLSGRGYDVYIGGVPAYSTLGWFADPVLNTFVHYPRPELARLIFHELAHQTVYVRDDTTFNESFAVTVQREGVRRWLAREGTPEDRKVYGIVRSRRRAFDALVLRYREELEALYASGLPPAEMRRRKSELFDALDRDYRRLIASWGGVKHYDPWHGQRPNNAFLASVSIYTQLVPAFEALLRENGGNLPRFYAAVRALARLPRNERRSKLDALLPPAEVMR